MQTQIVIWTLLFILLTMSTYLVMGRKVNSGLRLLAIALLSGVVVFYIRTGFGRYFTTIDESYYISLLGDSLWYQTSIVSGYMTPFSLQFIHSIFHNIISMIIGYSIVVGILYVITLFFAYWKSGISKNRALLAILLLFTTPLYLWSTIQIRPQQIGLLIGLPLAVLIVKGRPTFRLFVGILMLYIALIFAHVLSFILYSIVFVMYLALLIILKNQSPTIIKKYLIVAVSIIVSWIVFLIFPYSKNILNNMRWITNTVFNVQMSVWMFYIVSILALGAFIIIVYSGAKYFSDHGQINLDSFYSYFLEIANAETKIQRKYLLLLLVGIAVLAVFYIQFKLGARIYARIYNCSIMALVFFQMGNLFFVVFFLKGFFMKIKENSITDFDILSLMWIPLGIALLVVSFFIPKGSNIWGFHNWLIRTLQYFVVFASPVAAYSLVHDIVSENAVNMKRVVSLLLGILITISVLNTARVPGVYSYDTVWTQELVDLCQNSPASAIYVPRGEMSVYSIFSTSNLLKACGKSLEGSNTRIPSYLTLSSDRFYVYTPDYRPISFAIFESKLQSSGKTPWVIIEGNIRMWGYYTSLFGEITPVYLEIGKDCPLESDTTSPPAILIGGRVVNPCTARLEKERAVYVYLSAFSVRTPKGIYEVPMPNQWWAAKEGLFVIQTLEYYTTPVLIIEGTNADATLAAVYYFTKEVYPNLLSKYKNTKYIVGRWEEEDNTVIDIAKLAPQDTTGFSPGDKIEIIEEG